MSNNFELLKTLGFDTFLALYEYLKKNGHHQQEKVMLIPVTRLPVQEQENAQQIEVNVIGVKALAFEEIHDSLPFSKSVDVIRELIAESNLEAGDQSLFINFLIKLPTRSV
jgi:hypothetical protein